MLNSIDINGNTPLLHAASRNNVHTVKHILNCKNIQENKLLDLSIKNKAGKTILHYLVEHRDEENFRNLLNREELTTEIANIADFEGKTPMIYCLTTGSPYMARDILIHPTAKDKFRLDYGQSVDRYSQFHIPGHPKIPHIPPIYHQTTPSHLKLPQSPPTEIAPPPQTTPTPISPTSKLTPAIPNYPSDPEPPHYYLQIPQTT